MALKLETCFESNNSKYLLIENCNDVTMKIVTSFFYRNGVELPVSNLVYLPPSKVDEFGSVYDTTRNFDAVREFIFNYKKNLLDFETTKGLLFWEYQGDSNHIGFSGNIQKITLPGYYLNRINELKREKQQEIIKAQQEELLKKPSTDTVKIVKHNVDGMIPLVK